MAHAPMPAPFVFERGIPSDVRYIEGIVAQVVAGCAERGYSPRIVSLNVPVALSEALANAILRGNGDRADRMVHVRARVDHEELVVDVVDDGPGFDLAACTRDPTTPDGIQREDGRGLFLMRCMVDHIEQFMDGGNVVRFRVRRA
jgi:serine/threonine-protein kinase RsbW